jgi:CheY-like chemotaxis protein
MFAADSVMPKGVETILLVDDEAGVRTLVGQILRSCGYAVIEVADGDEAIQAANEGNSVDLLIADVILPRMDGLQVAERFRALKSNTRVLFLSGGLAVGQPSPCLQKPFTAASLARKVRDVLDSATGVRGLRAGDAGGFDPRLGPPNGQQCSG